MKIFRYAHMYEYSNRILKLVMESKIPHIDKFTEKGLNDRLGGF